MLFIVILSLIAGMVTALTPCVLPLLPVIVGGSLSSVTAENAASTKNDADTANGTETKPGTSATVATATKPAVRTKTGRSTSFRYALIVTASLIVSLLAFTILLKATTLLININPFVWAAISGVLLICLGLAMLFPSFWAKIMIHSGLEAGSGQLLSNARRQRNSTIAAILTGAALGPVFSSCSPTYAWVIATVLPAKPAAAIIYLAAFCVGLAGMLLIIALAGQALVKRLGWAADPSGWFQRVLAVIFILVGVAVLTGFDKKLQVWAGTSIPGVAQIEQGLASAAQNSQSDAASSNSSNAANDNTIASDPRNRAPELAGISHWINTQPLTLEKLRGKVVLIDFWTYSCINCQRTQPYLNAWYKKYHDQGLEIIGVHAPEFAFEKVPENVEKAVKEAGIKYPVALDNDFSTWRAYRNAYWPAKYLIDKQGNVVFTHFGEGEYAQTERVIQKLLGAKAEGNTAPEGKTETASQGQSPETYLGTERAQGFVGKPRLADGTQNYTAAPRLNFNEWTLNGSWQVDGEKIIATADGAKLTYRFNGKRVFLVMGKNDPNAPAAQVKVSLSGVKGATQPGGADVKNGVVTIDSYRLYRLIELPDFVTGATVTIEFPKGVSANAFTFG